MHHQAQQHRSEPLVFVSQPDALLAQGEGTALPGRRAGLGADSRARVTDRGSRWWITCSCGWTREASFAWTATAIAKLHARYLTGPDLEHSTITIEEPPDPDRERPVR